jgi:hypothetical protein
VASPAGSPTEEPFTLLESSLILSLPQASAPECTHGDAALLQTQQGPSVKPWAHVVCQMLRHRPEVIEAWLLPQADFFDGGDIIDVWPPTPGRPCLVEDRRTETGSGSTRTSAPTSAISARSARRRLVWSRDDARIFTWRRQEVAPTSTCMNGGS